MAVVKFEDGGQAVEKFQKDFASAQSAGSWMAAVWEIRGGKITMVGRTTWKFNRWDFLRAVVQLGDECAKDHPEEKAAVPEPSFPEKLPVAIPDIKSFPGLLPVPAPVLAEKKEDEKQIEVSVQKTPAAVIVYAANEMPLALPFDATEAQISEAVEMYKAGIGASQ